MTYDFKFKGKSLKRDRKMHKFHAFIITADAEEIILYEAVKKGFVERQHGSVGDEYYSHFPHIKVFSSTDGFGIQKAYQSFFFRLEPQGVKRVRVKSLGHEHLNMDELYFEGVGSFLTPNEIKALVGEDSNTYKFYQRQTGLSKRQLNELIDVRMVGTEGKGTKVRHIRF